MRLPGANWPIETFAASSGRIKNFGSYTDTIIGGEILTSNIVSVNMRQRRRFSVGIIRRYLR